MWQYCAISVQKGLKRSMQKAETGGAVDSGGGSIQKNNGRFGN